MGYIYNYLAGAIRNIDYDLIITGRQAIDGDTAQVGPQISEHLGYSCNLLCTGYQDRWRQLLSYSVSMMTDTMN